MSSNTFFTILTSNTNHNYYNPNSITISSGYLWITRHNHTDYSLAMYAMSLYYSGGQYYLDFGISYNNDFSIQSWGSGFVITNGWNRIETYWQRGSPGSFQVWLNGTSKGTVTGTNNLSFVTAPGIGCDMNVGSSTSSGTIYLARWKANDDGSEIGET